MCLVIIQTLILGVAAQLILVSMKNKWFQTNELADILQFDKGYLTSL